MKESPEVCGSADTMKHHRMVVRGTSVYISSTSMRYRILQMLSSQTFDTLMGFVIVVNSVTIGLELSFRLEGKETMILEDLEHFFMSAYLGELLLRFYAFRGKCLSDQSIMFDCVLVVSGVLVSWVMRPMGLAESEGGFDSAVMVVMRTLRLMRLARTVRLLVKFRVLWMLVRGLMSSAGTMLYTCILLVIVLYVLACVGVEMVSLNELAIGNDKTNTEPNEEFQAIVQSSFPSVAVTMMTLVQFICLDAIADIYKPLIQLDPYLLTYFMGTILVIGIVLMNLVTAVVVNSALEQAFQDKEMQQAQQVQQKTKLLKELRKLFERMDLDSSGFVSREEILSISDSDRQLLQNTLSIHDHAEIFDALDVDGSGSLQIEEFCDGIWHVAMSSAPIEIKKIEKQVRILREEIQESSRIAASTCQVVRSMQKTLEQQAEAQQRKSSPIACHPGQVGASSRRSLASEPGARDPAANVILEDFPSVADPSDSPARASDSQLRLEPSREALHAEYSATMSGDPSARIEPFAHAMSPSVQKLVVVFRHLHENIGSLLAEIELTGEYSNVSDSEVLDERYAVSTSVCHATTTNMSRASGTRELARELQRMEARPSALAPHEVYDSRSCAACGSCTSYGDAI